MENDDNWHSLKIEEVFEKTKTNENGLSDKEAKIRLEKFGYNVLRQKPKRTILKLLKD